MSRVIDAHHHLWRYTSKDYDWIDDSMATLQRDFLAADLAVAVKAAQVDTTIAVQARQTIEETLWLLDLAAAHSIISGVVGWVPLIDTGVSKSLEELTGRHNLRGVRHVLQAEPNEYMLSPAFQRGIGLLNNFGLAYDLLIHERQLTSVIQLIDQHPDQVFILDHVAKPLIHSGEMQPWARLIAQLAERPNVYCKISGMVTEADWQTWSPETLQPYIDVVLEAFGPRRLMYGSDWPVCLVASSYGRWIGTMRAAISSLSPEEQSWIMGRTAEQAYNLSEEN
ncbi:MAG TPA: amidohydrolase family protein [Acidisarcina sp.]